MTKFSVAIIAKDRAAILPQCLASAQKLSDDVVIVTNADHKFINYSNQKNYAASRCIYDWVLSLDSDEYLSSALIKEITNLDFSYAAYAIPRHNIIFGKVIHHTNWDPNPIVRLYDKTKSRWQGVIHEQITTAEQVGRLNNPIIHHNYSTVEEFISKMNGYTSLETKTTNPVYDFLRRYIWHQGFLDGWHGLFLSYLMMIYHTVTWVKKNIS